MAVRRHPRHDCEPGNGRAVQLHARGVTPDVTAATHSVPKKKAPAGTGAQEYPNPSVSPNGHAAKAGRRGGSLPRAIRSRCPSGHSIRHPTFRTTTRVCARTRHGFYSGGIVPTAGAELPLSAHAPPPAAIPRAALSVFGPESPPWNLQRRFRARRRPHGMDDFGEYVRRTSASTCDDGASDGRVRLRQFSRNWNKKIFTVFTPCPLPAPSGAEKINPRGSKR
jgi:hypothetical protein